MKQVEDESLMTMNTGGGGGSIGSTGSAGALLSLVVGSRGQALRLSSSSSRAGRRLILTRKEVKMIQTRQWRMRETKTKK